MEHPRLCSYHCRYATLESLIKHSDIQNDITEAYYFCSLYNQFVWGEKPICTQADWDNEQPLPSDDLNFYSYKEYIYELSCTGEKRPQEVIGKCLQFPHIVYQGKDHVDCLLNLLDLVEAHIEYCMRNKILLPNPYSSSV